LIVGITKLELLLLGGGLVMHKAVYSGAVDGIIWAAFESKLIRAVAIAPRLSGIKLSLLVLGVQCRNPQVVISHKQIHPRDNYGYGNVFSDCD
jgi:hypothetical protein